MAKYDRLLGVTSARRSQVALDLPTIGETVSGYDFSNWHGILAPRGTPLSIINNLNTDPKNNQLARRARPSGQYGRGTREWHAR